MALRRKVVGLLGRVASHVDQRFPPEQEVAFKRSLESCFVGPVVTGFGIVVGLSPIWRGIEGHGILHQIEVGCEMTCVIVALAWLVICGVKRRSAYCRSVDFEYGILATVAFFQVEPIFNGRWYLPQFFGRDPLDSYGHAALCSEEIAMLWLGFCTTFSCLVLPIRCHLSWIVPVYGLASLCAVSSAISPPFPQQVFRTFPILSCTALLNWLGGCWQEKHTREKWLAQNQVDKVQSFAERQHEAFSHLLNRLCDCLVHLGPDLELTEPCPRLNTMLFMRDGRSLKGSDFRGFLASEVDAERFEAALSIGRLAEDPTGILPVRMRDSKGAEVQMHLYFSCFCDQGGLPYYVVGVTEVGDGSFGEPAPPDLRRHPATCSMSAQSCQSFERVSEDVSSSDSSLALQRADGEDQGEVSVKFRICEKLQIVSSSPAFTALCGPAAADSHLLQWLPDPGAFVSWTQHNANNFLSNCAFSGLRLRTPHAAGAGLEFVAKTVLLDSISCVLYDGEEHFVFQVALRDIRQQSQRRKSRGHHRAPAGPACSEGEARHAARDDGQEQDDGALSI